VHYSGQSLEKVQNLNSSENSFIVKLQEIIYNRHSKVSLMSKNIKISEEVYDALIILKRFPSISFNDIIKGLIDSYFPGDFFDTDDIDRQLWRESLGLEDYSHGELRQIYRMKKRRKEKDEN
jgi:hypothetical protein